MLRHVRAAGIAAVLGALAFYVFLAADYRSSSAIHLRTDGDLQAIGRGFYPLEQSGNLTYAWTAPHAELLVPAIDRRIDWRLTGDVSIWRPPDVQRPRVVVSVDGVSVLDRVFRGPFKLDVPVPRRPGASHATIIIETSPEFVPGPQDPRKLGVSVASLSIKPNKDLPRPPVRTAAMGMLAIAVLGIVAGLLRLPTLWVCISMIAVAWAQAWLMTRGIAAHVTYSGQVFSLAAGLGAAALGAVWMAEAARREQLNLVTLAAVALSLIACYLKLMVLMHPGMPIGDGVFHAHRLEYVMGGRLYFTSVTPDNYTFPYPVLLYVAAAPLSFLTSDTLDRVALLRFVTIISDAGAGMLLYWMIVRATSDRLAGLASVAWYHAIPITPWIMTWGNLTNAFAQSLFVASLALVVGLPVQSQQRRTVALLAFTTCAALLTHPSTCAILVVVLAITGGLYMWRGNELRSSGKAVLIATALAAAVAVGLYYAWFPSVYVSELSRVASEAGSRASAATSTGVRFAKAVDLAATYFGWAAIAASAVGVWRLSGIANSARLTLLLSAWAGTGLVFLAVGILTPIDLRYHFAAFPALAIAAGFACAWAWRSGIPLRVAATLAIGVGAWEGISQWMWALSPR
jgi:hypothetical protein